MSSTSISCLFCDDVRQEKSGKNTLVGVYNDVIIFPQSAWDENDSKAALTQLYIANYFTGFPNGPTKIVWWIEDPDGTLFGMDEKKELEFEFSDSTHALLLRITPVIFSRVGQYRYSVKINGFEYEKSLEIRLAESLEAVS